MAQVDIDFKSPQILKEIEDYLNKQVILFDMAPEAYTFVRNFELYLKQNSDFPQSEAEIYSRYQALLVRAKFIALPMLREAEIVDLFKEHFVEALSIDGYDLWQKLKAKLVTMIIVDDRDVFKKNINEALVRSKQLLTNADIKLGQNSVRPTIGNWLRDCRSLFGTDKTDTVTQVQYVTNSNNARSLSNEDREKLKRLIYFCERLKYLSTEPGGVEEGYSMVIDGKWKTLNPEEGIWEESDKLTAGLDPVVKEALEVLGEGEAVLPTKTSGGSSENTAKTLANLVKAPAALKQPTPAFLFDETDEREADRYRERMANGEWRMANNLESQLRELAEEVVKEHNFSFKDEVSHKRFVQLFVSFLKDVRDVIEAKEMLLKSTDNGGLGLTSEKTEKVIGILQQAKKEFELRIKNQELGMGKGEEILPPSPRLWRAGRSTQTDETEQSDIAPKPKTELDKMIEAEAVAGQSISGRNHESRITNQELGDSNTPHSIQNDKVAQSITVSKSNLPPVPSGQVSKSESVKFKSPLTPEEAEDTRQWILQEIVNKIETDKTPIVNTSPVKSSGLEHAPIPRQRLVDVKAPPRVLGPIEELRTLSIVDLRRLSDNPADALQKLQKKIDIIGEASVGKKVEAIRAWQASLVYQKYLEVGRASIDSGQSVAGIIAKQTQAGEVTLNEEEFNAIVDFNERIRF
ncbi:MAG: hypothetical protein HY973_00420 [Candidatus Kerfeldbacteria bacterium]|nr:hypothetical protein [Candidatus Kerfeldbacteria bacterium]